MIHIALIVFLISVVFMILIVPYRLWRNYKLFQYVKKNEPEFFTKNIDVDRSFSSPWVQFWDLMLRGKYKQFKSEKLRKAFRKDRRFKILYLFIFASAIISLIYIWISTNKI